ncbi:hypothetical protein GCM10025878_11310 [Leuconostoc gasicomitatum]|uniref:Cytidine/deoxycytidylate deaminase family protein n=1 Tax=Leuconostoc gasicomitatum TaxID=115778 RepID=A0ABM9V5X2_9LACO|nr:cytidine/deoxycytidylate deaminase family protein [Leuconostoc gelidum JB7]MBZ5957719.1 cytidine deaminase [Leuconostoc gasicomitatum]CUR63602.1 Cytidine/deoxycytidylate deaminase [Leuconostoc gasicomitatum KG16-1]CUW06444.1 Cytidine/deoxycytidylate deaminase family protein [Leuconostoc inhae]MBZ5958905.1 cytidine deaminase [Leuconostoc gasicomitatum]
MDIWEKLYNEAKVLYNPHEVSPFVYAEHVVCALEAEDGQVFTGYCFFACFRVASIRLMPLSLLTS